MRLYRSLYLLLLLLVMHITGQAQLQKVIKDIFSADEITTEHADSDSIASSGLQKYDATFKLKSGQIQKLDSLRKESVAKEKEMKYHDSWWQTGKHIFYFVLVLLGSAYLPGFTRN